jgi:hypothetical protein
MKILDYLSANQRNLIKTIVHAFENSKKEFEKNGDNTPINGIFLKDAFNDTKYIISPCKYEGQLAIQVEHLACQNKNLDTITQMQYELKLQTIVQQSFIERLTFIERLWEHNLIIFTGNLDCKLPEFRYNDSDKQFHKEHNISCLLSPINSKTYFEFISKYYMAQIIPSEYLIRFYHDGFITVDKHRFNLSQIMGYTGIFVSIAIACASPWLMTKCSSSKVDEEQFETIIKQQQITDSIAEVENQQLIQRVDSVQIEIIELQQIINGKTKNAKP